MIQLGVELEGALLVDPREADELDAYVEAYWQKRQRRGMTRHHAFKELRRSRTAYGLMMLDAGHADGLVAGVRQDYPATIRPALQIIGVRSGVKRAAGMYMVVSKTGVRFLADTTINIEPDEDTLRLQGLRLVLARPRRRPPRREPRLDVPRAPARRRAGA